ncbi:MAG: hypothetical protein LUQ11_08495 [Methylococcaceae bacterium]|nr:hypothetical protein [Methylococcaceae bacterium]
MLFDLFSKRMKKERGEFPDIYHYEEVPNKLRVQIVHMLKEAFSNKSGFFSDHAKEMISQINDVLCREYGVFRLAGRHDTGFEELSNFVLQTDDYEQVLDVVEVTFRFIDKVIREDSYYFNRKVDVDSLIEELNQRFRESGIGYQYESGELMRVDSQFIHAETVKPVLKLLSKQTYESVNEEFLTAHEHYRHGRFEETTTECLKSIESLLKTICTTRGWIFDSNDTAKKLINIVLHNGLVPPFMQNQLNVIQTLLESGVPTVRNKLAGHGQGPELRTMPDFVASYVLHLTATTLLFLANADNED